MEFRDYLKSFFDAYTEQIASSLAYIGEMAYQKAIESKDYQNVSGDLRSSIGWAVFFNAKMIRKGGFVVQLNGTRGSATGENLIKNVKVAPKGFTLVFVAGMHYATYLEAKGRDVNTAGELFMEQAVETLIKAINNN